MIKRSTIRYAAKQCYQLMLMRGIDKSTQCGMYCQVNPDHTVTVVEPDNSVAWNVPIAKSWVNL